MEVCVMKSKQVRRLGHIILNVYSTLVLIDLNFRGSQQSKELELSLVCDSVSESDR